MRVFEGLVPNELHPANSGHCERAWGVIPVRFLSRPMKKEFGMVCPRATQAPTAARASTGSRRSLRLETHSLAMTRSDNAARIQAIVIANGAAAMSGMRQAPYLAHAAISCHCERA